MNLTIIQTADETKYKRLLDITSRTVNLYSFLHSYTYVKYVGLKRGRSPVHAAYNRAYMLKELMDADYRGWVLYLDADAYVKDLTFDCVSYLSQNSDYDFIAAETSTPFAERWAINNGIFFINLGSAIGHKIATSLLMFIDQAVPQSYWDDSNADWPPQAYDDQVMMCGILGNNPEILERVKKESKHIFNYEGTVFRQSLRSMHQTFDQRVVATARECDAILNGFIAEVNPYLVVYQ
jgi:hypothetical protein